MHKATVVEVDELQKAYAGQHAGSYTGKGEVQKMSRGWSVFRARIEEEEERASPEPCKQGTCSEAPRPKRVVCPFRGLQD